VPIKHGGQWAENLFLPQIISQVYSQHGGRINTRPHKRAVFVLSYHVFFSLTGSAYSKHSDFIHLQSIKILFLVWSLITQQTWLSNKHCLHDTKWTKEGQLIISVNLSNDKMKSDAWKCFNFSMLKMFEGAHLFTHKYVCMKKKKKGNIKTKDNVHSCSGRSWEAWADQLAGVKSGLN